MDLTTDRHVTLSGPPALVGPAWLFLAATAIAAVVRASIDFDKGIWLVAFLFLVGFVAQMLLATGQAALRPEGAPPRVVAAEAVLWNVGSLLVPLATMAGGKAGVLVGSLALIAAIGLFARSALAANRGEGTLRPLYLLFAVFMAVSVATGIGLSWASPWL